MRNKNQATATIVFMRIVLATIVCLCMGLSVLRVLSNGSSRKVAFAQSSTRQARYVGQIDSVSYNSADKQFIITYSGVYGATMICTLRDAAYSQDMLHVSCGPQLKSDAGYDFAFNISGSCSSPYVIGGFADYIEQYKIYTLEVQLYGYDGRNLALLGAQSEKYSYNFSDPATITLPEDPIKEGHTFIGWFLGAEINCDGSCVEHTNEPLFSLDDVHPHYTIDTYSVSYDYGYDDITESIQVEYGAVLDLPAPSRDTYVLVGWFLPDGTQYTDQPVKGSLQLTARWKVQTFTVTFYVDNDVYIVIEVEYGSTFLLDKEKKTNAQNI